MSLEVGLLTVRPRQRNPMSLSDRIAAIPFRRLMWLLPVTFTLHELEEWNIMPWFREQFVNPPNTSDLGVHTWLIGISLVGFLLTALAAFLPTARATAVFVLPFFIVLVFGNALHHIYWQLAFSAYAPGVLAAGFLNIPSIALLSWHAARNRLVGWLYLTVLYVACLLSLLSVVRAGRTVTPPFHAMYNFSEWLARLLFGAA